MGAASRGRGRSPEGKEPRGSRPGGRAHGGRRPERGAGARRAPRGRESRGPGAGSSGGKRGVGEASAMEPTRSRRGREVSVARTPSSCGRGLGYRTSALPQGPGPWSDGDAFPTNSPKSPTVALPLRTSRRALAERRTDVDRRPCRQFLEPRPGRASA